mmetsp:Transcript_11761/g.13445  ORF Transcript_11761/g.13445 Transcript_11761/m.13445 type:complete len:170 (+) Transcript_11761:102-611(+)
MIAMKNLRRTVGMVAFPRQIRKTIVDTGIRRCSTVAVNDEPLLQKKLQQGVYQRRNNTTVATIIDPTVSTGEVLLSLSLSPPLSQHFCNNILSSSLLLLLPAIMGSTITATYLSTVLYLRTITTSFSSLLWNVKNDGLYLISTMKRRKKMMNKHKLRKRRKKNRMKNKK